MELVNYTIVEDKLKQFVKKYYVNRLYQGIFISILLFGIYWLTVIYGDYFIVFNKLMRTTLFIFSLFLLVTVLGYFIVIPILRLSQIIRPISFLEVSNLIKTHFPEIQDKLLNVLELYSKKVKGTNEVSNGISQSLLLASIEQKSATVKPYSFNLAINYQVTRKLFLYFFGFGITLVILSFVTPDVLNKHSKRLLMFNTEFPAEALFYYKISNSNLNVVRGGNLLLEVSTYGKIKPSEIFIVIGDNSFRMDKSGNSNNFTFEFSNVVNTFTFYFKSGQTVSEKFSIQLINIPQISQYSIIVTPPAYTGEVTFDVKNSNDIVVPEGSLISYTVDTKFSDSLQFILDSTTHRFQSTKNETFQLSYKAVESGTFEIVGYNSDFGSNMVLQGQVTVIPDLFPSIDVSNTSDSLVSGAYFFSGNISDDYGFSSLYFVYTINKEEFKLPVSFVASSQNQLFYHYFNFNELQLKAGVEVSYYFVVYDNDRIHGAKASKTGVNTFRLPDEEEITKEIDNISGSMEDNFTKAQKLVTEIKKSLNQFQNKSLQENMSNWEKNQQIDNILQKQDQLEDLINTIKSENLKKSILENLNKELSEDVLNQQLQLQELMDNLLNDDLKKLLDDIKKLKENLNLQQQKDVNTESQLNLDELNKQLQRNFELLQRYNMELKLEKVSENLKELSEEHEILNDELTDKNKNDNPADIVNELKENQKKFDEIAKDYEQLLKDNQALKDPLKLDSLRKEISDVNEDYNKATEPDSKNNLKDLKDQNNEIKESIDKMEEKLSENSESAAMEQQSEDINNLRQIFDNLVTFSFNQEALLNTANSMLPNNPKFGDLIRKQQKLMSDFTIIDDSLTAIANRVPSVSSLVFKDLKMINNNLSKSNESLLEYKNKNAGVYMQYTMTSANNLALLLSESIDQMKNQPKGGSGKQSKTKKQQAGNQFGDMKKEQEKLKDQLEQMLKQMQEGEGMPENVKNEQLSKMLGQQEILQQMLRDLLNGTQVGSESQKMLNEINRMFEETKQDIILDRVTPQTLLRQKNITTRLLEAEKSESERELDDKRESKTADDYTNGLKKKYEENMQNKNELNEVFDKNYINLNNYFKIQFEKYLQQIY